MKWFALIKDGDVLGPFGSDEEIMYAADAARPDPRIREICKVGEITVFLVNGRVVRDSWDLNFTQGGNSERYNWMDKHEIWIDDANIDELDFILLHELHEVSVMRELGLGYERAHEIANEAEAKARNNVDKLPSLLEKEIKRSLKVQKLLAEDAGFKEGDHPRGQPENKGQFASGGGGGGAGGEGKSKPLSEQIGEQIGELEAQVSKIIKRYKADKKAGREINLEDKKQYQELVDKIDELESQQSEVFKKEESKKQKQKATAKTKRPSGLSPKANKMLNVWSDGLDTPERQALKKSDEFGEVLNKLPTFKGTVYRGAFVPKSELKALNPGSVYPMNVHNSSSKSKGVADNFIDSYASEGNKNFVPVRFEIDQHSGADLVGIEEAEVLTSTEEEVVLKKGTKYSVVSVSPIRFASLTAGGSSHPGYKVVLKEQGGAKDMRAIVADFSPFIVGDMTATDPDEKPPFIVYDFSPFDAWFESDHPRKDDGKFGEGSGPGKKGSEGSIEEKVDAALKKMQASGIKTEYGTYIPKPGEEEEFKKAKAEYGAVLAQKYSGSSSKSLDSTIKVVSKFMSPAVAGVAVENVEAVWKDKYKDVMSLSEAGVISGYCSDAYKSLNKGLRAGTPSLKNKQFERKLNNILDKLPTFKGTTYRGAKLSKDVIARYEPGQVIRDPAFLSTSKSKELARPGVLSKEKFIEPNVHFKIKGKGGRQVTDFSDSEEEEVLFKSNTEFKVVSNNGKIIVLEEV